MNALISNIIAALALVLSVYSVTKTIAFNKRQEQFSKVTDELNKLLLREKQKEAIAVYSANISAKFVRLANDRTILKIYNQGKSLARNVNIQFLETDNSFGIGFLAQKLPIDLEEHQHVDFPVSLSLNSPRKVKCILTWEDETGSQNKERELSL